MAKAHGANASGGEEANLSGIFCSHVHSKTLPSSTVLHFDPIEIYGTKKLSKLRRQIINMLMHESMR
jgi:hypothetical protein